MDWFPAHLRYIDYAETNIIDHNKILHFNFL